MLYLITTLFTVNDWICDAFKEFTFSSKSPISRSTVAGFENCGFGRIIELDSPISLNVAAKVLKKYLGLSHRTDLFIITFHILIYYIFTLYFSSFW